MGDEECEQLRALVQDCIEKHLYTSASFFADKLVTLSGSEPGDIYLLAQASNRKPCLVTLLMRHLPLCIHLPRLEAFRTWEFAMT